MNVFALLAYITSPMRDTGGMQIHRFEAFTALASFAMLFSLKSLSKFYERDNNNMARRARDCKVFYNFRGPKYSLKCST